MKWDGRRMTMRRVIVGAFVVVAIFGFTATAGEFKEIELIDGSTIRGELVSFNNGVYQLRTSSLGMIEIEDSKVVMIRSSRANPIRGDGQETAPTNSEIDRLQRKMTRDEDIMLLILSLENDPDIQEVLGDPDIMKAVNSGDIAALSSNPKFMKLLENPKIKQIQKKALSP
jgi:hypothetical protein